jgi:hypothetical protein
MRDAKEQLQEDVISILEGFGVDEAMSSEDYNFLVNSLCDAIIKNLN